MNTQTELRTRTIICSYGTTISLKFTEAQRFLAVDGGVLGQRVAQFVQGWAVSIPICPFKNIIIQPDLAMYGNATSVIQVDTNSPADSTLILSLSGLYNRTFHSDEGLKETVEQTLEESFEQLVCTRGDLLILDYPQLHERIADILDR